MRAQARAGMHRGAGQLCCHPSGGPLQKLWTIRYRFSGARSSMLLAHSLLPGRRGALRRHHLTIAQLAALSTVTRQRTTSSLAIRAEVSERSPRANHATAEKTR
eukprot:7147450-Pyramimonas_sp.AAC.1